MFFPETVQKIKANKIQTMKKTTLLSAALLLTAICTTSHAQQKWSVGTNLLGYANFLTINAEATVSVHRNWSVGLMGEYNPFYFPTKSNESGQLQNKTITVSAGARYWPFYVHSGFFYGCKLQWDRYNSGGIFSPECEEGDAFGLGLNFGYALMLTEHLNMEFGIGFWAGGTVYRRYASTVCGKRIGSGTKAFIAPDNIVINLVYIF